MNIIQRLSPEDEVTSDDIKSLQGLNLAIACNSWGDAVVAAELFGNDWESKTIPGTIHKVTGKRAGSLKFSINIPLLDDTYRGYDWEYILDYLVGISCNRNSSNQPERTGQGGYNAES